MKTDQSLTSPLRWGPRLHFAMGLPIVVLNMVSAVDIQGFRRHGGTDSFWNIVEHADVNDQIPMELLS